VALENARLVADTFDGTDAARRETGGGLGDFAAFGAVPVSGKNLYRLLAAGECVLLFPGGVREAFKRKDEKYKLFWPAKPEFVRVAARHGATIVPFSAVGAEDGFDVAADVDDFARLPFGIGDGILARSRSIPSARAVDTRVTQDGQREESFVQPLLAPRIPERFYFKFGAPIRTAGAVDVDDAAAVAAAYASCKSEVEDGIEWLLRKRAEDPFRDTPGRILWEQSAGKQAPTFRA
jgi:hypothetical protein